MVWGTPEAGLLERRLAGIALSAFSSSRQRVWLRSESNSASVKTQLAGVWACAARTSPGKFAQSFRGASRALWAR